MGEALSRGCGKSAGDVFSGSNGIGSDGEVNRVFSDRLADGLPSVDLAQGDLAHLSQFTGHGARRLLVFPGRRCAKSI